MVIALPSRLPKQGLRHIGLAALLEVLQAAAEAGGTYAVLRCGLLGHLPTLQAVGLLRAVAAVAYSVAGLLAVASLAYGSAVYSSRRGRGGTAHSSATQQGTAAALLLADLRQEEEGLGGPGPAARGALRQLLRELRVALGRRHLGSLLRDGGNVAVRATVVQGSTFLVALAAARLGQSALAAHHIAQQLWVLPTHLIAGLQTAALVLGGRLAAAADVPGGEAHR